MKIRMITAISGTIDGGKASSNGWYSGAYFTSLIPLDGLIDLGDGVTRDGLLFEVIILRTL